MGLQLRFRLRLALDRLEDAVGSSPTCIHEDAPERPSPHATLSFNVGGAPGLLCYGRPSVRNRTIFGDVVPWGALWRTGANEATVLYLPTRASVAGISVKRGRYSLYTVPEPDSWTIILNRSIRQSGRTRDEIGAAGNHFDNAYVGVVASSEVGRATVPNVESDFHELLTAQVQEENGGATVLRFAWERRAFDLPISPIR